MPTHRRPAAGLLAASALAFTLLLTGCSAGAGAPSSTPSSGQEKLASSLTELFKQALQNPDLSVFEREVIERAVASGKISDADYEEAFRRYEQCVADLGYQDTWVKLPNGIYKITPPHFDGQTAADKYNDQTTKCADGTTMRIEALYGQQQSNPDLLADPRQVAVQCLVKGGFVDASYTADAFEKDLKANFESAPFDPSDEQANDCLFNAGFAFVAD